MLAGKGGKKLFPFEDYKIDGNLDDDEVVMDKYRVDKDVFFSFMCMCRKVLGDQRLVNERFERETVTQLIPSPIEAFTLWVLEDKYSVWEATIKNKTAVPGSDEDQMVVPENTYTLKANMANRWEGGVSKEGQKRFHKILKKVNMLRKIKETGEEIEQQYLQMVRDGAGKKKKRKSIEVDTDEWERENRLRLEAYDFAFEDDEEEIPTEAV